MSRPVLHPAALHYVGPEIARDDSEVRLMLAIHRHGLKRARGWLDRDFDGLSQAEAVLLTGLSQPSVSTLAKGLRKRGLLVDGDNGLVLEPAAGIVFGIDIGFRQVRAIVSDLHGQPLPLEDGEGADFEEFPARLGENVGGTLTWMAETLTALEWKARNRGGASKATIIGVGISFAGPVDRATGKLKRAWDTGGEWELNSVTAELQQRLGWDTDFIADRDANASAAAEAFWSRGQGAADVLYCKWAEGGVSAAITFDHQIYHGSTEIAGEIGHAIVPIRDNDECLPDWFRKRPPCTQCNRQGCLRAVTSIDELEIYLKDEGLTAETLVALAGSYDSTKHEEGTREQAARHALEAGARCLGRVLVPLIEAFNPKLVILGGKIGANAYPYVSGSLKAGIQEDKVTPAIDAVDVSRGSLALTGETSVRGAIALALIEAAPWRLHALAQGSEAVVGSGNGARAARAL